MMVAVFANARTAVSALDAGEKGWTGSFNTAFQSGAIMGFSLCGLSLFVLYSMCLIYRDAFTVIVDEVRYINYIALFETISGFGLGGSCIALFGRVGGGIFTKAADVGADLSGKVIHGIPEDEPRNPAVIADNVGDNVGDVAGMGADLFESFVGSIIAAATLTNGDTARIMLPFWTAGGGIVCALLGFFFVRTKDGASQKELLHALHKAIYVSSVTVLGLSALVCSLLFDNE